MASLYPCFEREGFFLLDAAKLSELYPQSFFIPTARERYGIHEGAVVKLIFRFAHPHDPEKAYDAERMWVIARERTGDHWIGELDNEPHYNPGVMHVGHLFHFHPDHIIAIEEP